MKWIKRIVLSLLFLLLILLTVLSWIVSTQAGLRFTLDTLVNYLPELKIANVYGDWSDLNLYGVNYQTNNLNVYIDKFNLSLQVDYLKCFQLRINNISIEGISININKKNFFSNKTQFNSKFLPINSKLLTKLLTFYPILLNLLTIENISIQFGNAQILLDKLTMIADWKINLLTVNPIVIDGLVVNLPKTIIKEIKSIKNIALHTNNTIIDKSLFEVTKVIFYDFLQPNFLQFKLPEIVFPININLQYLQGTNWCIFIGATNVVIDNFTLIASIQGKQINIKKCNIITIEKKITLNGNINLTQQLLASINIKLVNYFNNIEEQQVNLKLEGNLLKQIKFVLNFIGSIKANLIAKVELLKKGLPIQLILDSEQFNWPLYGKPKYRLRNLYLHLRGKMTDYDLSLHTNIDGLNISPMSLMFNVKLNEEQCRLTNQQLNTSQNNKELSSIVNWNKSIICNGLLTLSYDNVISQYLHLSTKFQGKIVLIGNIYNDGTWQLKIPEVILNSNLNGNLFQITGEIDRNIIGKWSISNFKILFGDNKLIFNGNLSSKLYLDGIINIQDINIVLPILSGEIYGHFKLRGNLKTLRFIINIKVQKFKWQDNLIIDEVIIHGSVCCTKCSHSELNIVMHNFKQADLTINNFNLNIKGNERQHNIKMNVNSKLISGYLTLQGCFNKQKLLWKYVLNNALFNTLTGKWQLNSPIFIEYDNRKQEFTLSPHCWLNTKSSFCVSNNIRITQFNSINIFLYKFDLTLVNLFLPTNIQLTGNFNGNIKVNWCKNNCLLQVKLNLTGDGIKIKRLIEGSLLLIEFQIFTLDANIDNTNAVLRWSAKISNNGKFLGNIHINDLQQSRKLSGIIDVKNISLASIYPILNKGEELEGNLNANLKLSGNMKQPLLNGNLVISNILAKLHCFPFNINRSFLRLNFLGANSQLTTYINTPEGYLKLIGEIDWYNIKNWHTKISVSGKKIRIALPNMICMDLYPDVIFEATPKLLTINGRVNIPWARIIVQDLPKSPIDISLDEVILDSSVQLVKKKSILLSILTNLKINIGDDVYLNAFGLKSRLTGSLKVVQDKQRLGLNGEINILEGKFSAYGQELIIRKGQILFSGLVDQPFLNIEAIRSLDSTNDNLVVGIRIIGLANKPKLIFFSDPIKPRREVLSYLLRNEELDNSNADSTNVATLIIGIGVSKTGKLLTNIGKIFGISDLTLDTQGVGNRLQIIVSGAITNNLQIKYGIGVFNSLATLTLRYCLIPKLYLEAVFGINHTLDLFYRFNF